MTNRGERSQSLEGFDIVPSPLSAAATLPHTEDGRNAHLVLRVMPPSGGELSTAIVTAVVCHQSVFGYPNDEAWQRDPRSDDGGASYGFYEVIDSTWPDRLTAYNRRNFPHFPTDWGRHFVVTCHDASAQFLAHDLTIEIRDEGFDAALSDTVQRLWQ
jgi:hypothetical protein